MSDITEIKKEIEVPQCTLIWGENPELTIPFTLLLRDKKLIVTWMDKKMYKITCQETSIDEDGEELPIKYHGG